MRGNVNVFTLRRADERQHIQVSNQEIWRTFHPLSLVEVPLRDAGAPEPRTPGFGVLDALDENRLSPGAEVALLPDREAETITYVLRGALMQEDSKGHTEIVSAGELQRMTLERGAQCSERNASQTEWVHFLRISLHPAANQADNTLEQRFFSLAQRRGLLCIVGSQDGRRRSVRLHQDAVIFSAVLSPGHHLIHALRPDRMVWLHVVGGEASLGEIVVGSGDGAGFAGQPAVSITALEETEILLLDLHRPAQAPGADR
jgi:redox-sensitive bicupin YhaK (pirin superfamily)